MVKEMLRLLVTAILLFICAKSASGQTNYSVPFLFGGTESKPLSGVIQASDGMLYGLTFQKGSNNCGALYRLANDGSQYQVLHSFSVIFPDNFYRNYAILQESSDGRLYGSSPPFGLFRVNKDGSDYVQLISSPVKPGIAETTNGWLYGVNDSGLFRIKKDGTEFEAVEHSQFWDGVYGAALASDGNFFSSKYIQGTDGWLYGMKTGGEATVRGFIYKRTLDGTQMSVLRQFTGSARHLTWSETNSVLEDGAFPRGRLIEASDGMLYGTTQFGGHHGGGTLFRVTKSGEFYEVIRHFSSGPNDGGQPTVEVIEGNDGRLYGTTSFGGEANQGVVFSLTKTGADFRIIKKFSHNGGKGGSPLGDLFQASDGYLYGTTSRGGSNEYGTVYRLNSDGSGHTILKSFSFSRSDGGMPLGGVIEGPDRALYGTTSLGGSNFSGTIYKLQKDGAGYRILHHFSGGTNDGARPARKLTKGSDGYLYGVTRGGGMGYGSGYGYGVIFRINSTGSFQVIHHLTPEQGINFTSVLTEGPDGFLYGTEPWAENSGKVFRLSKSGGDFTNVLTFPFGENQYQVFFPWEGVSIGTNGHLYGTARGVYKIDPLTLEPSSFPGYYLNSASLGNDGALYGIAHLAGNTTAFVKGDQAGSNYTRLYATEWAGSPEEFSKLLIARNGSLLGTSAYAGPEAAGSVFKLYAGPFPPLTLANVGYSPPAITLTFSGTTGQTFRVQATDNLQDPIWHPVGSATIGANGTAKVLDPQAGNYGTRFYRAAQP